MQQKHIYIIYTGGTIGMQPSKKGYVPSKGFIAKQMAKMPEFSHLTMPRYTIHEYENPVDSANMTPAHWQQIGEDIARVYDQYDGFVILHGTDTMAYTASALSFSLENLSKPVILTGSQLPLSEIRNDARSNLINAILLTGLYEIPEVCIYFNNKLFRGNRARKISATRFSAFESPNFPTLISIGTEINPKKNLWLKKPDKDFKLNFLNSVSLAHLNLFPGFSADMLAKILQAPLQTLIIASYGSGNAPNNQAHFLRLLQEANQRDIIVINCSQCIEGQVNMHQYATGNALNEVGVISGQDMTPEAIIGKLHYLFSQDLSVAEIKQQLSLNLRGELTA